MRALPPDDQHGYVFVLAPALIAAPGREIDAVTAPATEMLNAVMQAIPTRGGG